MNTKNILITSGIIVILTITFYLLFFTKNYKNPHDFTIAIVQSATHPALDKARTGFINTIKTIMPDVLFIEKNGERSISSLHAIMDELQTTKYIDLLYTIATPALSAAAQREKERPIVFTAVTDPSILHLEAQENICGVTDAVDEQQVLNMIVETFSPRQIAILFDPAESNSVLSKNRMQGYAKPLQITMVEYAVSSSLDIQTALEHMNNIDCVILPTDNLLASAISLITRVLKEKRVPCISLFPVEDGVALYAGIDYYDAGCQAAHIAIAILKGEKKPNEIGFVREKNQIIKQNTHELTSLGITVADKNNKK